MAAETVDIDAYKFGARFYNNAVIHQRLGTTGRKFREKWTIERTLGEGGQGFVYLQREGMSNQLRAVKRLAADYERHGVDVERELCNLLAVKDCPDQFVQFFGWYENKDFVFCAMEYVEHGDLGAFIKNSASQVKRDAREISRQLLQGLVVLHTRHICHRDLKPQNVLIVSTSPIIVKLADFGISKSTLDTKLRTAHLGTKGYIAPEIQGFWTSGSQTALEYTDAVDMWALGCIVHEMLTLEKPFMETTAPAQRHFSMTLLSEFCTGKIELPMEVLRAHGRSQGAIDFVKRLLVYNASDRMSAVGALRHSWISGDPSTALLRAAQSGYDVIVKALLNDGVDVNGLPGPEVGRTALHAAAEVGCLNVVELLLRSGADANAVSFDERLNQNPTMAGLQLCEKAKGNPTSPLRNNRTALQAAAGGGHLEVVQLLLSGGAKPNANPATCRGQTALQAAAGGGHLEVCQLLLDNGAEVNAEPARGGRTALQAAAGGGYLNIAQLLLSWSAERCNYLLNDCPSYIEGRSAMQAAAEGGHFEVVRWLLDIGAKLDAAPAIQGGRTALQAAAEGGHRHVVQLLLIRGANPNEDPAVVGGRTALIAAAAGGHVEIARLLLESGASVNTTPNPLHKAARRGHTSVVELLLVYGADVNARRWRRIMAGQKKHTPSDEYSKMVKAWMPTAPSSSHIKALQLAAEKGHLGVVKQLLACGAHIEDKYTANFCSRCLSQAIKRKDRVTETILEVALSAFECDYAAMRN